MVKKTDIFNELNSAGREITIEENYFNNSEFFVLLSIKGIIDTYNSNDFMNSIMKFCKVVERKILVINIKEVNYMSSTGIGAFVQINKFCHEENIKLYIMGIQSNVGEVFSLLGFKSFFNYITELKDIKEEKIVRSKFPHKFKCPHCSASLEAKKTGAYKCSQCQKTFRVTEEKDGSIAVILNIK
jgi:anti-anti-sigma factor